MLLQVIAPRGRRARFDGRIRACHMRLARSSDKRGNGWPPPCWRTRCRLRYPFPRPPPEPPMTSVFGARFLFSGETGFSLFGMAPS